MALTNEQLEELLSQARAYLNITWTDSAKDTQLQMFIVNSANRLEAIYGHTLHFTDDMATTEDPLCKADYLARDLLLSRVFYANEKALDDYEINYRGDLLSLKHLGDVLTYKQESEDESGA